MNPSPDPETARRIRNAAIDIYTEKPEAFTMKSIARKARLSEAEIYSCFPNKTAILKSFYSGIVPAYKEMVKEIDGYKQYDLSEKLSNFVYSSLDMLQEHRDFVEKSFEDLIFKAHPKSDFQEQVELLVEEFVKGDPRITASSQYLLNSITFSILSREFFYLIKFWIQDESPGSEKTMALTDKLTGFLNEMLYSAVLDKGLDLGRFLLSNRVISPRSPFWETCLERFVGKGVYR